MNTDDRDSKRIVHGSRVKPGMTEVGPAYRAGFLNLYMKRSVLPRIDGSKTFLL